MFQAGIHLGGEKKTLFFQCHQETKLSLWVLGFRSYDFMYLDGKMKKITTSRQPRQMRLARLKHAGLRGGWRSRRRLLWYCHDEAVCDALIQLFPVKLGAEQLRETSTCLWICTGLLKWDRGCWQKGPSTAVSHSRGLVKSPWAGGRGKQLRFTGNALTAIKAVNYILNLICHSWHSTQCHFYVGLLDLTQFVH